MDRDEARQAKAHALAVARELIEKDVQASTSGVPAPRLSVGLAPRGDGRYGVALRYRRDVPGVRDLARRVADEIGEVGTAVDVRRTGRIRPLGDDPGTGGAGGPGNGVGTEPGTGPVTDLGGTRIGTDLGAATGGDAPPVPGPRPPVVTAQALGETGRVRPLRPGVSIAHVDVTAGTLGAFVLVGGVVHALSNYHVLAGSPAARPGDTVLQPGPADGGRAPRDRVGTLARVVPLAPGRTAVVDAAVALLDEQDVDPTYPVGRITRTARALGGETVGKVGRTTAVTTGVVTAIELDDVVVGYGEELGNLRFDDQIEIEGAGRLPFSRGGDSGSLVYRQDGVALGLLFAGSETGGDNGRGLTYVNPIDAVLEALDATLLA
ncbi:hypothetical protein [Cellulomonas sp. KH9]|uniref:hypothetical protein n=1 Tax=Cellulomonas sp. KH9 TaxID=1855324 RepID=UPI0008E14BE9|nr:hypothetical protein [Cellulomonas sp. KH9]SFK45582.1 hypothetical protein SAMN05216467_3396 [Cellulomonas sp. KH9]